jgi:hypothetical protein
MKKGQLILIGTLLVASLAVPLAIRLRAQTELQKADQVIQKQREELAELSNDNQHLSNVVAQVSSSHSADPQQVELLKLRNELAQLRRSLEEIQLLQQHISRLHDREKDAEEERSYGPQRNTALLVEELTIRKARAARMKRWLDENPRERIPELQFVSDDRWMDRSDRPLITDDDYRVAIGLLRADGEQKFIPPIFEALKRYAKEHDNQFPPDVYQLKSYFRQPIDDAILDRYQIVPAKTLVPFLAETGGDWLITQKEPINKEFDGRSAVGLTSFRGTVGQGRWDPVP